MNVDDLIVVVVVVVEGEGDGRAGLDVRSVEVDVVVAPVGRKFDSTIC